MNRKEIIEKEIDEINKIYDYNKSREINIDKEYSEEVRKKIEESISKEKLFG